MITIHRLAALCVLGMGFFALGYAGAGMTDALTHLRAPAASSLVCVTGETGNDLCRLLIRLPR